ncbi:hypothetical protein B0H67DRAFT_585925 [Lasiosphaeris hirsuta]|uniref:Uncharacterized protein n=1 Tax=Lasiosphaeris hirsuta TaxID=260670 RepID=A0AA40DQC3_9PEZI|nr:hypothetical protein B0H67DRAFT_585925 [Lasiosphaeris hirsuta]
MDGYKDKLKSKWSERPAVAMPSSITPFGVRDKAKSLIGRGGDNNAARVDHVSQPLSSLRDPSSFGPPPRRFGTGSSGRIDSPPPPPSRASSNTPYSSQRDPSHSGQPPQYEEEAPPSRPYRADTTGLTTSNLPPPPPGISVPAFGIGSRQPASTPPPPPPARSPAPANPSQLNELQSRFSRLSSSGAPPDQGTTMDQKRAALQTVTALRQNPSSVSASDAMAAGSTFNNFRQRHSEQVAAGVRSANNLREKYGGQITMHDNDNTSRSGGSGQGQGQGQQAVAAAAGFMGKKKPPPPPPKKFLTNPSPRGGDDPPPPPVPLATRPQF